MTFDELREEARKQGYRLVHRDSIRTATTSIRIDKQTLHHIDRDHHMDVIAGDLRHRLADFFLRHNMVRIQELPHEWDMEFRADLTVLAPKGPSPDSDEYFIYRPRPGEEPKP